MVASHEIALLRARLKNHRTLALGTLFLLAGALLLIAFLTGDSSKGWSLFANSFGSALMGTVVGVLVTGVFDTPVLDAVTDLVVDLSQGERLSDAKQWHALRHRFYHYHQTWREGETLWICTIVDFRASQGRGHISAPATIRSGLAADEAHAYVFEAAWVGPHVLMTTQREGVGEQPAVAIYPQWAGQNKANCAVLMHTGWGTPHMFRSRSLMTTEPQYGVANEGPVATAQGSQLRALWDKTMNDNYKALP